MRSVRMKPRIVNGELRMLAWPYLDDGTRKPVLDILLELDAPDELILKHITPLHNGPSWQRWQKNKGGTQ